MLKNGYMNLTQMPKIIDENSIKTAFKPISTRVVSSTPGRLRLRVAPSHRQSGEMQRIANALQANPNINQVRTNIQNGSIVINHDGENGSLDNVFASLRDLGIIFGDIALGKSQAAVGVSNAVVDLNKQVQQATSNVVDLRVLFPLGLGIFSIRQLLVRGLQLETIPWYVLAWYAFDSFIKLHGTSQAQSTRD
ncbi:HMA2 domain-containing protein [Scytonema sp. PCC 10023]|uniref:HMA2 domain-containing protein n=1 Tax=Scytonema sp. PCC 10023 TaxID=1680591 RepID=UPI0039C5E7E8